MNKNKKVSKKLKRRLLFLSSTFILLVGVLIATVFNDFVQIMNNKSQTSLLNIKYNDLLSEEESLESEITKLKDVDYVARYAREKFMYTLPNEVIIKLPENQ